MQTTPQTNATVGKRKLRLFELRQLRQKIFEEVEYMGELKNSAAAIVDLAYELSGDCYFEQSPSKDCWILRPANWIALDFRYGRASKKLHVSLDAYPTTLDDLPGMERKQGRFPNWSKISLERVTQLPTALQHVMTAYQVSRKTA